MALFLCAGGLAECWNWCFADDKNQINAEMSPNYDFSLTLIWTGRAFALGSSLRHGSPERQDLCFGADSLHGSVGGYFSMEFGCFYTVSAVCGGAQLSTTR